MEIALVGAGNVARALAPALQALPGCRVAAVWSRTYAHAEALAQSIGAVAVDTLDALPPAHLYLLAVSDDAIPSVAAALPPGDAIVAHTSGSVPIDAIPRYRRGVFYPLQTFTGTPLPLADVPFFLEASDDDTYALLEGLARALSTHVYPADSRRRALMHVAAVMACNFTMHLWARAADLLAADGLPFDILAPLLQRTLDNALTTDPASAQTGPARRGDLGVLRRHLDTLHGTDADIYRLLSTAILNRYHPDEPHSI